MAVMIPRLPLAANGPTFSRLIYGTWRVLDDAATATPENLLARLHACLELGITTLDTAEIYGLYKVEEFIGETLRREPGLRDKFEIVTKAGIYVPCEFHPDRKTAHYNASAARLVKSAEKSLRLLGTDRIDLFLVHRPDWLTSADETDEGLNKLMREGKILHAGVSNYNVHQVELLNARLDRPLVTNQIEFSLLHMDPIYDGTADQCQRLGMRPMAWSPLAQGRLMSLEDPATVRVHAKAAELADKYDGAGLDQIAYAWILAHPSQPLPIIGTNKLDRLQSTARSTDIQLDREDWYALWEAAQGQPIP